MSLTEPSTMITDYVLGAVSITLGLRLMAAGLKQSNRAILFWGIAFAATAAAAFVGGTYHGFLNYLGPQGEFVLWKLTMLFAGLMSLTMLIGSLFATAPITFRHWLIGIVILKFAVFSFFAMRSDDFLVVVLDYVPAMIGVLICHLVGVLKFHTRNHLWIISGVLISFLGAWLQQQGIGFNPNINHNDLYHVLQTLAMITFFKGASALVEFRPS